MYLKKMSSIPNKANLGMTLISTGEISSAFDMHGIGLVSFYESISE